MDLTDQQWRILQPIIADHTPLLGLSALFEPGGAPAGEALQGDQMWGDLLPVLEFIYIQLARKWNLLLIKCRPR